MTETPRSTQWIVWGGLILVIAGIGAAYVSSLSKSLALPAISQIPDFTLTNQDNQPMGLSDLRGQIWIADIIFTRCPGQCLKMSASMKAIQASLPSDSAVKLVSFTTDPGYDTPPVLKTYSERFGAQPGRWYFLSGDKSVIRHVAVDGLKLVMVDKTPSAQDNPNDLFIHSAKIVVVDKTGQVRAFFDGEEPMSAPEVVAAVNTLSAED